MSPSAYAFLGLTAIVAVLVALTTFVALRFIAAARSTRGSMRNNGGDTAILAAALEEAVGKLKERERAMSARAEASERLSGEIIGSLTSGLLVVGLHGDVRIINPAAMRLLGVDEHAPFENYRQLPPHAAPLAASIDECLTSRRAIVRRALKLQAPGGLASHLGVTVSPLFEDASRPSEVQGAICLFTDLTAVFDLEDQVRLKDSLARVGELTAGIAHEFRNGLATIHGYSRLIDLDELPKNYRPYIEGIRAETQALGEVVTNFLNFARPAQLTVSPVDLKMIADRTAEDLRAEAAARGGELTVSGSFATVDGDEVLLRQALSNLLRNAFEACMGAGVPPKVKVTGDIDRAHRLCRITVDDNGPGIPAAERERIFRPFFTTKAAGTGLGLALVQKIIVTHNGRVAIASSPLGGARVQLTLPLSAN